MLKITDKYYADTDAYNWILVEKNIITEAQAAKRKKVQAGDVEYKTLGYYKNLQNLLTRLFEKHKKSVVKECNLTEYIEELKELQNYFLNEIKNIKVEE